MASYKSDYSGQGAPSNPTIFNRVLRSLSNVFGGLDYNDMKIRNAYALGVHEETSDVAFHPQSTNMYNLFTKKNIARFLDKKSIAYLDRTYLDKRKILRQYSIKDEIKDFIIQICDECIIYDENNKFCYVKDLPETFDHTVRQKYQENFNRIMNEFNFIDGVVAWNYLRTLLIDGYLAFEIIYDDRQKAIIDLAPLDPLTLIVATDPMSNTMVWIQFPDNPQLRRVLLDSQIIYISYSNNNEYGDTSYIEGLIRPYNQLKIIEQTRIMFNIINATVYQKFTIPTKGLSKQKAEEQIGQLISNYSEHVEWDDTLGTLTINGSKHLPYNKAIWLPEGDMGTPNMEIISSNGNDLNEETTLKYFSNALKRASRIPFPRFEAESGGGPIFTMESADVNVEEQKFANFIGRIRANFKEILTKPLKLQMCMEFPELKDDEIFLNSVDIIFSSNQTIEEWKRIKTYTKKIEAAQTMLLLLRPDQTPYFHIDFIVNNILKLSQDEIQENNAYWIKAKAAGQQVIPGEPGAAPLPGGGGGAPGGGGSEFDFGGGQEGAQIPGAQGQAGGVPGAQGQAGGVPGAQGQAPPAQGGTTEFEF